MYNRLRKGFKHLILFASLLLFLSPLVAQNGQNPFELVPRSGSGKAPQHKEAVETETTATVEEAAGDTIQPPDLQGNPFALAPVAENPGQARKKRKTAASSPAASNNGAATPPELPGPQTRTRRLIFSLVIFDLILIAIVLTLLRNFFRKSISSFTNENLLNQVFRERQSGTLIPFLIFYFLFFFNLALFLFLLMEQYQVSLNLRPLLTFFYLFAGVSLAFFAKHVLLRIVGFIFPIDQELSKYSFTIMIFGIIMGFLLIPINLLIAYGPENMTQYVIYISLGGIVLIYLFRSLRGLFIANKYVWFYKFHFLLYICTVEIAPAIIILKLILKQI